MTPLSRDLFYELDKNIKKDWPIIIFGTGKFCEDFLIKYKNIRKILFLIDNDFNAQGNKKYGLNVKSPEILRSMVNDNIYVVIAIASFQNRVDQLKSMGIKMKHIKVYTISYKSEAISSQVTLPILNKEENIKEVCIVGTVYTLLLYFLYRSERDYFGTYFVLSGNFPGEVAVQLLEKGYMVDTYINAKRRNLDKSIFSDERDFKSRMESLRKIVARKKLCVYGHDHLPGVLQLLGSKYIVLEDGLANYYPVEQGVAIYDNKLFIPCGHDERICKLILTGKMQVPEDIKDKTEIVSLERLWNKSSEEKKQEILNIFDTTVSFFSNLVSNGRDHLLMTENYSDGISTSEKKMIGILKKIIEKYDRKSLVIKPHPADNIDYSHYFKDIPIIRKSIPAEIFQFVNFKPKVVIAIDALGGSWAYETFKNARFDTYAEEFKKEINDLLDF